MDILSLRLLGRAISQLQLCGASEIAAVGITYVSFMGVYKEFQLINQIIRARLNKNNRRTIERRALSSNRIYPPAECRSRQENALNLQWQLTRANETNGLARYEPEKSDVQSTSGSYQTRSCVCTRVYTHWNTRPRFPVNASYSCVHSRGKTRTRTNDVFECAHVPIKFASRSCRLDYERAERRGREREEDAPVWWREEN